MLWADHIVIRGRPPKLEFIYKKLCIHIYMFKLQSPSKYSPFGAIHLSRYFFHCSKQFLNLSILMSLSASAIFGFTSFTSAKHFPLKTFFTLGNKPKCHLGEIGWIGMVGHRGHAIFGQKLLNTQCTVGRCTHKSPIMKWANALKESQKKFTEAEHSLSQQRQLVHWYRWVPTTLT